MENTIRIHVKNITSMDKELQNAAFAALMEASDKPVEWAYEVWDEVVADLSHKDNRARAIASQVLCNLATSDPEKRILRDFEDLLEVTRDARFVTARHCMQAIWKVGLAGEEQREMLVRGLERRFNECAAEKNCTLIRFDILVGLRELYDAVKDEGLRAAAQAWIEKEEDPKYRKKYQGVWKGIS